MITLALALAALYIALENGRTSTRKAHHMSNQIQDLTAQLADTKTKIAGKLAMAQASQRTAEADRDAAKAAEANALAQLAAEQGAHPSDADMAALAQSVADLAALGADAQPPAPSVVVSADGSATGASQS